MHAHSLNIWIWSVLFLCSPGLLRSDFLCLSPPPKSLYLVYLHIPEGPAAQAVLCCAGQSQYLAQLQVGHMKTLIILTGGCLFFGDLMPPKKLAGVAIAMAGIIWYTHLKMAASSTTAGSDKVGLMN
jgi:hypothetical protein